MFPASNIVCARRPLVESTISVSAILDSANTEIKAFKMVTRLALNNTIYRQTLDSLYFLKIEIVSASFCMFSCSKGHLV